MASQQGMAKTSTRTIWKGAITFGLVHIPSMDPVGYKRVNKKTDKEIDKDDIIKGIEWGDGQYVVLTPEEIAAAYPRTTRTIEMECFVDADEVPFVYLERPYYVAPINKGEKVYALLRKALQQSNKMAADSNADQFRDSFREEIMKMVQARAKAGQTETVTPLEDNPSPQRGADVIDLTELLKRSLQTGKAAPPAKKAAPAKAATRRAA